MTAIPSGANAEDCPHCLPGTVTVYPWICPGHPEPVAANADEQPADTIRRAAAHLRHLAAAAGEDGADWEFRLTRTRKELGGRDPLDVGRVYPVGTGRSLLVGPTRGRTGPHLAGHVGRYIAALDPAAGLALADVLDAQADTGDVLVLALARRILGEEA